MCNDDILEFNERETGISTDSPFLVAGIAIRGGGVGAVKIGVELSSGVLARKLSWSWSKV